MNVITNNKSAILGLIGLFMPRVILYGMNPIAVAYFAAAYAKNRQRGLLFFCMLIGLGSSMEGTDAVKYGLTLCIMVVVNYLGDKKGKHLSAGMLGGVGAVSTFLLAASNAVFRLDRTEYMLLGLLEVILILTLSNLFQWGMEYWLYGKRGQLLNNEQMISVIAMITITLYGMPEILGASFSVREMLAYLFILFMGYKYGAGAGAIAGAFIGITHTMEEGMLYISLFCLLGILAGMFRELGRFGSGICFLLAGALLNYVLEEGNISVEHMRALLSGTAIFLMLPKVVLYITGREDAEEKENVLVRHSYQSLALDKLKDFSSAFKNLSDNLYQTADIQDKLGKKDVLSMFDELSRKVCNACTNCTLCWDKHYYDTYHEALTMVRLAEEKGNIRNEDISPEFAARCIHFEDFIRETRKNVEYAKYNLSWSNKLAESRAVIADQLGEVANIIKDFSMDLCETKEVTIKQEEELLSALRAGRIKVKKLAVIERRGRRLEIRLTAKTKKNDCVTARETAVLIGDVLGRKWKPGDTIKNVIPKEYEDLFFVEDTSYKTLTGMARTTKNGERISGDNFSFLHLNNGEMIMVLSDGMGSGYSAYRESESVVELLENLLEAGFREESAVRLINSVLVLQAERQTFSTLDISVINLFTGFCEFVKNGASATFIKREGWIETIQSATLPVGMLKDAEPEGSTKKLYDGDMVVMVTDGVMDCFPDEDKEFHMENLLMNISSSNPQDVANRILNHALEQCGDKAPDDMSVMVAGIWEKGIGKSNVRM